MADARSVSGSFFSSCSTNSGGSSLAPASVVVVVDEEALVDKEEVVVVVVKEVVAVFDNGADFCSPSSFVSLRASGVDAFVGVVSDEEAGKDVRLLPENVVEEFCCKTGNDVLLEVEQHVPVDFEVRDWIVAVDAQQPAGEIEVVDGEKVALDNGRTSKSSGRKKHHEFHLSLDVTAIDNPEVEAGVDGDGDGVCRDGGDTGAKDSDWVDVVSIDSNVSGDKDSGGGDSEDSNKDGKGADSDWLLFFLIVTAMC